MLVYLFGSSIDAIDALRIYDFKIFAEVNSFAIGNPFRVCKFKLFFGKKPFVFLVEIELLGFHELAGFGRNFDVVLQDR